MGKRNEDEEALRRTVEEENRKANENAAEAARKAAELRKLYDLEDK